MLSGGLRQSHPSVRRSIPSSGTPGCGTTTITWCGNVTAAGTTTPCSHDRMDSPSCVPMIRPLGPLSVKYLHYFVADECLYVRRRCMFMRHVRSVLHWTRHVFILSVRNVAYEPLWTPKGLVYAVIGSNRNSIGRRRRLKVVCFVLRAGYPYANNQSCFCSCLALRPSPQLLLSCYLAVDSS